ncbi:MAG: 23S rRNA (uracil(1939)-C(5))-methyltransferase RlmD [Candidatus Gracilibacteria bacterium]
MMNEHSERSGNQDHAANQRTLHKGDEIELTIENLAFGGEGIAKIQIGERFFTIFVEEVVPGDKVLVQINHKKSSWARGFVKKLIEPSLLRIRPRCKHFADLAKAPEVQKNSANLSGKMATVPKGCGGCAWQFLSYEDQLKFKEQQVRDAFERIGNVKNPPVLPIMGVAREPWFYRNKMEFSFHKTLDGRIDLGLHCKRQHYDVIELTECFLLGDYVGELVKEAREFFRKLDAEKKLDPEIILKTLTIREGKHTGEKMLILTAENGKVEGDGDNVEFARMANSSLPAGNAASRPLESFKNWALDFFQKRNLQLNSLYFIHIQSQKGKRTELKEYLIHGKPTIREEIHLDEKMALTFDISPQAFFQPNTLQAGKLYSVAMQAAKLQGKEIVYDLFCGTGTIGIFCAQRAKKVYGIELNASALENARQNAQLNNVKNVEFFVGDVDHLLSELKEEPDVIIVDPPRNGLMPSVVAQLIEKLQKSKSLSRLVYVSCNPSTMARDAQLLIKGGYVLKSVQPVDMFPQTYHIENVALFERA